MLELNNHSSSPYLVGLSLPVAYASSQHEGRAVQAWDRGEAPVWPGPHSISVLSIPTVQSGHELAGPHSIPASTVLFSQE